MDVWAAGVITYILLCGFPPFASQENNQGNIDLCCCCFVVVVVSAVVVAVVVSAVVLVVI